MNAFIKIRVFPPFVDIVARNVNFRLASRVDSIFEREIKYSRAASSSRYRRVAFATGDSYERSELLGELRIDRARSTGVC